jgi:NADH dehydrogenase FAD-containing subunit
MHDTTCRLSLASIALPSDTTAQAACVGAQVANQQGRYLASVFNMHRVGVQPDPASRNGLPAAVPPFKYRHLGSFAYVGADKAVLELAMQGGCFRCRDMM